MFGFYSSSGFQPTTYHKFLYVRLQTTADSKILLSLFATWRDLGFLLRTVRQKQGSEFFLRQSNENRNLVLTTYILHTCDRVLYCRQAGTYIVYITFLRATAFIQRKSAFYIFLIVNFFPQLATGLAVKIMEFSKIQTHSFLSLQLKESKTIYAGLTIRRLEITMDERDWS
jgi:hypothetical protein